MPLITLIGATLGIISGGAICYLFDQKYPLVYLYQGQFWKRGGYWLLGLYMLIFIGRYIQGVAITLHSAWTESIVFYLMTGIIAGVGIGVMLVLLLIYQIKVKKHKTISQ